MINPLNKTTVKTFSWLVVSFLLIFAADYVVTRHFWESVLAAFGACALKTPFYSAHEVVFERAWNRARKSEPCTSTPPEPLPCSS
jgi:uncharacterized membrane protein